MVSYFPLLANRILPSDSVLMLISIITFAAMKDLGTYFTTQMEKDELHSFVVPELHVINDRLTWKGVRMHVRIMVTRHLLQRTSNLCSPALGPRVSLAIHVNAVRICLINIERAFIAHWEFLAGVDLGRYEICFKSLFISRVWCLRYFRDLKSLICMGLDIDRTWEKVPTPRFNEGVFNT